VTPRYPKFILDFEPEIINYTVPEKASEVFYKSSLIKKTSKIKDLSLWLFSSKYKMSELQKGAFFSLKKVSKLAGKFVGQFL
jgi:hypothetical protein